MNWKPLRIYKDGWDSEDGRFRIVPITETAWLLIDFDREGLDGEFWRQQFGSLDEAKATAEEWRAMT